MTYAVKNVKVFEGLEGQGYNCSLYRGRARVAAVLNDGNGGMSIFRWADTRAEPVAYVVKDWNDRECSISVTPEERQFRGYCDAQPPFNLEGEDLEMTPDLLVGTLVDTYEANRELREWCRTDMLYRLKGDEPGSWRVLSRLYSQEQAFLLRLTYEGDLVEIANERFI